jgi:hypothetical protein
MHISSLSKREIAQGFVWAGHANNYSAFALPLSTYLICRLIIGPLPYSVIASQLLAQALGFKRSYHHPQNLSFGSSPNLNPLALKMEFVCLFLNCLCHPQSSIRCAGEAMSDRPQSSPQQYLLFSPAAI